MASLGILERPSPENEEGPEFQHQVIEYASEYNGLDVPTLEQYDQAVNLSGQLRREEQRGMVHFYGPHNEEIPLPYARLIRQAATTDWRLNPERREVLQRAVEHQEGDEMDSDVLGEFLDRHDSFRDEADLQVKFDRFKQDAQRHLTLSEALYQREASPEAAQTRRRKLSGALGAAAVLASTNTRKIRDKLRGPKNAAPVVAPIPTDQHHRREPPRKQSEGEAAKERSKRRRVAVGVAAALGLTALMIGIGVHETDSDGQRPMPAATPSRTPTPSPTVAPTVTPSPTTVAPSSPNGPAKPTHPPKPPGQHAQSAYHPKASEVRAGEFPWDTLHRLGVPQTQIVHDLDRAARLSHHTYRWHGHGTHRWIEVDGQSGTRHIIAALGPYITIQQ